MTNAIVVAALLTIESLQIDVQSLVELSQQTRINFTTVENSIYVRFFSLVLSLPLMSPHLH